MIIGANYRDTLHDDVTRFIHRPRENRVGELLYSAANSNACGLRRKSRRVFCYVVSIANLLLQALFDYSSLEKFNTLALQHLEKERSSR